jgi:hypothetical protein
MRHITLAAAFMVVAPACWHRSARCVHAPLGAALAPGRIPARDGELAAPSDGGRMRNETTTWGASQAGPMTGEHRSWQ